MREDFLPLLRATDDRLAALPGLEGWAGDGHAIAHATHDNRNGKDAHSSVKAIYRIDLRTGWAGFLDLRQPIGKDTEVKITTLKRLDKETLRCGAPKGARVLWVYDSAAVDFRFGYNLKCSKGAYRNASSGRTRRGRLPRPASAPRPWRFASPATCCGASPNRSTEPSAGPRKRVCSSSVGHATGWPAQPATDKPWPACGHSWRNICRC
jgi:hypothetical protein